MANTYALYPQAPPPAPNTHIPVQEMKAMRGSKRCRFRAWLGLWEGLNTCRFRQLRGSSQGVRFAPPPPLLRAATVRLVRLKALYSNACSTTSQPLLLCLRQHTHSNFSTLQSIGNHNHPASEKHRKPLRHRGLMAAVILCGFRRQACSAQSLPKPCTRSSLECVAYCVILRAFHQRLWRWLPP